MAGFARGSRANAVFFFVSVAAATDTGKNERGCPGEIGRAAGFPFLVGTAWHGRGLAMISARGVARAAVVGAMVLLAVGGAALGQTHAPWPTDWNNWNDPALWVTVGNPRNTGELAGAGAGGNGPDRICGAVGYTCKVGKFEVTAGQYTAFLNAVAKTDTYGLYNTDMVLGYGCQIQRTDTGSGYTYIVLADWANRPVNCVSWGDAARFANWLTHGQPTGAQDGSTTEDGSYYLNGAISDAALVAVVRKSPEQGGRYYIPTEDEWYKAAYYKSGGTTAGYWDYPTSSDTASGRDMADASGNNANYYTTSTPGAYPIDSGKYTTVAGEFQNSDSPYGTFDQGGNVWEWNEAIPYGSFRGLRGGSFGSSGTYLRAANCSSGFGGESPSYEGDSVGFRVSEVPEPATMSLLAFGGLVLLYRRRGASS